MSNRELIEAARKAKGSRILPTVLLGHRYDAEELLLAMADALQAQEWNHDMEAAPSKRLLLAWNKSFHTGRKRGGKWIAEGDNKLIRVAGQPHAWKPITLPEETQ